MKRLSDYEKEDREAALCEVLAMFLEVFGDSEITFAYERDRKPEVTTIREYLQLFI